MHSANTSDNGAAVVLDWMSSLQTLLPPIDFDTPSHNTNDIFGMYPIVLGH